MTYEVRFDIFQRYTTRERHSQLQFLVQNVQHLRYSLLTLKNNIDVGSLSLWNKPGTAQVGAISKAQKDSKTKTTFSTTGDNKSSQKTKNREKKFRIFFEFF